MPIANRSYSTSLTPFLIDINSSSFGEVPFELITTVDGVTDTLYFKLNKRANLGDFDTEITLQNTSPKSELTTGDIDGDKIDEIAFISSNGTSDHLCMIKDGSLSTISVGTAYPIKPVFADLEGDGTKEIIIVIHTSATNKVLIFDKTFSLVEEQDIASYIHEITSFLVNDVNGDGILDIVVAGDYNTGQNPQSYLSYVLSSPNGYEVYNTGIGDDFRILSTIASANIDSTIYNEVVFVVTRPDSTHQENNIEYTTLFYAPMKITLTPDTRRAPAGWSFEIEHGSLFGGLGGGSTTFSNDTIVNFSSTDIIISNPHPDEEDFDFPYLYYNIGFNVIANPYSTNGQRTINKAFCYNFNNDIPELVWDFDVNDIPEQYQVNHEFPGDAGLLLGGDFDISNPGIELILSTYGVVLDSETGNFIQFLNEEWQMTTGMPGALEFHHHHRFLKPFVISDNDNNGVVDVITYEKNYNKVLALDSNGDEEKTLSFYIPNSMDISSIASGHFDYYDITDLVYLIYDNQNLYLKKSTFSNYTTDFTVQWSQRGNNSRSTSEFLQPVPDAIKSDYFVWNNVELTRDVIVDDDKLEFAPGVELFANHNKGITVNSSLDIFALPNNKITMKGLCNNRKLSYWKGIQILNGANLHARYVEFSNCNKALSIYNSSSITLEDIDFPNNQRGIELYNSSVSMKACSFINSTGSNTTAILLNDDSELLASTSDNDFIEYNIGVDLYESAVTFAQGNCNFANETYNIKTFKPNGIISATENWWGNSSPSVFISKFNDSQTIDFTNWLLNEITRNSNYSENEFDVAEEHRRNGDYLQAITSYFNVYGDTLGTCYKYLAITGLYKCYKATNQLNIYKSWLINEIDYTSDIALELSLQRNLAMTNRDLGYAQEAIDYYESVVDDPLTYIDSCYAVIDIGFTILESSSRARSKYPRLNPESLQSHIAISNKLLESIYNNEPILFEDYSHAEKPTMLYNNYPNPFNPSTTISFYNNKDCDVKLKVYNVRGQLVKTLLNEHTEAGNHNITWHGRNNNNQKVASGVYFYRLKTDSKTLTKKCLLLK